jgi:hypothetical protein
MLRVLVSISYRQHSYPTHMLLAVLRDVGRGRELAEIVHYYLAYSKPGFEQYTLHVRHHLDAACCCFSGLYAGPNINILRLRNHVFQWFAALTLRV